MFGTRSRTLLSPHFPLDSLEKPQLLLTLAWTKETPEAPVFKVDLPGFTKEDVKLEIEDDRVLQITADRNVEREDKNETRHHVERSRGKFLRRFRLPENGKIDQVRASIEDGVLTVTVPKEEVKKPELKAIEISG